MDSSFSRVPATGLQHTPRTSLGAQFNASSMASGSPGQNQNNSSYLPGYLLGGHTPVSQMSYTYHDSPYSQGGKTKSPGKLKSWSPSRSHGGSHSRLSSTRERKDVQEPVRHTFSNSQTPKNLRGKAPPVADLFSDTGHASPYGQTTSPLRRDSQTMDVHMVTQISQTHSPAARGGQQHHSTTNNLRDHLLSPSRKSFSSPAQVDPFYSQGETIMSNESLDECCVTVFGFPPAASSFILQQFSQYGNILKHEVASNGNWMHLKFQSKLQAKKALSKNGKIFGSNVMVGVIQCIDKHFMFDNGKENLPSTSSSTDEVPSPSPSSRKTPIRPLTAAYQAASSDLEYMEDVENVWNSGFLDVIGDSRIYYSSCTAVAGSDSQTPQKNNNLVSKAMEYVFGW